MNSWGKGTWLEVRTFFNTEAKDNHVTREELLDYFCMNSKDTIDQYRMLLTRFGYVEVVKRGLYKLVKQIPAKLNLEGTIAVRY